MKNYINIVNSQNKRQKNGQFAKIATFFGASLKI